MRWGCSELLRPLPDSWRAGRRERGGSEESHHEEVPMSENLTPEAQRELERRRQTGEEILRVAWFGGDVDALSSVLPDDRESAASDAIANVLTALLGPAGTTSYGGSILLDRDRAAEAQNLLRRAFDSYQGDAEDYTRAPEPGEYGYEED